MTVILKKRLPLYGIERKLDDVNALEQMVADITKRTEGQQVAIMLVGVESAAETLESDMLVIELLSEWTQDYPLRRGLAHGIQKFLKHYRGS